MQTIKIRCLVVVVLIVLTVFMFIAGSGAQKKDVHLLFASADTSEAWARFRGPNGSGVSPDRGFPVEFGPRKNVLWSRSVPEGKSSPVLTQKHVFLTAHQGEKLIMLCLDRRTGKIVWERFIPRQRKEFEHTLNSAASPTPTTDGENVYAFFRDFGLISFSPTGKERWRTPLGPFSSLWGLSISPILVDDKVILTVDQLSNSYIAAFGQADGKLKWKTERRGFALNHATPLIHQTPDRHNEILVLGPQQIVAYHARTGDQLWSVSGLGASSIGSPLLNGHVIFSLSYAPETTPSFETSLQKSDKNRDGVLSPDEFSNDENPPVLKAIGDLFGNRDGVVEAEDWRQAWQEWSGKSGLVATALESPPTGIKTESRSLWTYSRSLPRVSSPLLYDGVLYIVANGGILTALNPKNGEGFKTDRLRGAIENYFASPVAADGKVFLTSESGKVVVIRASPEWEILAVNDLGEDSYATPALSKGNILMRTSKTLFCFGKN